MAYKFIALAGAFTFLLTNLSPDAHAESRYEYKLRYKAKKVPELKDEPQYQKGVETTQQSQPARGLQRRSLASYEVGAYRNRPESNRISSKSFGIDVHLGGGMSSFSGSENPAATSKIGFMAGLGFEIDMNRARSWAFRPEINYIQKGINIDTSRVEAEEGEEAASAEEATTGTVAANYLEIPMYLKYKDTDGKVRPTFMFGPYVSMLNSKKITNTTGGQTTEAAAEQLDTFNTFDYGVSAAVGMDMHLSKDVQMLLSLRYTMGFGSVFKTAESSQASTDPDAESAEAEEEEVFRNNSIYLVTGIRF